LHGQDPGACPPPDAEVLRAMPLASRTALLCRHFSLHAVKSLGQNFLIDDNLARKIARAALEPGPRRVLEIGPGLGALTGHLAASSLPMEAFEKDPKLEAPLRLLLTGLGNVALHIGDFLAADLTPYTSAQLAVVGNLPYYITTPILERLFEMDPPAGTLVVTVQREMGQRLRARAGSNDYSSLSVYAEYCLAAVEEVCRLGPAVFSPRPGVESVALRLTPRRSAPQGVASRQALFRVVRAAFGYRRKTLRNALAHSPEVGLDAGQAAELALSVGIDPGSRGETLTLEQFIELGNALVRYGGAS